MNSVRCRALVKAQTHRQTDSSLDLNQYAPNHLIQAHKQNEALPTLGQYKKYSCTESFSINRLSIMILELNLFRGNFIAMCSGVYDFAVER